jgi:hypothetical protein
LIGSEFRADRNQRVARRESIAIRRPTFRANARGTQSAKSWREFVNSVTERDAHVYAGGTASMTNFDYD